MIRRVQSFLMGLTALLMTLLLGFAPAQANTALGAYQPSQQTVLDDQHSIQLTVLGNLGAGLETASEYVNATNRGFGSTDAITVSGTRAIDKAVSYENGVRTQYTGARFFEREFSAVVDGQRVNGVADDVTIIGGKPTAVEAKFTENWATSPRNPDSSVANLPFAVAERKRMVTQARNYSAGFRGGAVYHTNSTELATHYSRVFNDAGITNFRFVITPTQ